jgi:DNA-binding IclR family transcriptional regulator
VTNVQDLEAEFATIRQRGFAECVEEIERGMCSVAAPIAPSGPGAMMSIGATGSVRVFTPAFREKLGSKITKTAYELSTILGWSDAEDTKTKGLG